MELIPASLAAILVIVLGVLPGVPGDKIYRLFVGSDWREDNWQRVLRLLGFSISGLALYAVAAPMLHMPPPRYLSLDYLANAVRSPESLASLFAALLGNFVAAAITGLIAGTVVRSIGRWGPATGFTNAWDNFIATRVPKHWVIVRLTNGDAYAGILDLADTSVRADERDLVLQEPALYEAERDNYVATPYQYLYLSGDVIASVGVVLDRGDEGRITIPGQPIFSKEARNDEEINIQQPTGGI